MIKGTGRATVAMAGGSERRERQKPAARVHTVLPNPVDFLQQTAARHQICVLCISSQNPGFLTGAL